VLPPTERGEHALCRSGWQRIGHLSYKKIGHLSKRNIVPLPDACGSNWCYTATMDNQRREWRNQSQ
jgi:hypothetical protein